MSFAEFNLSIRRPWAWLMILAVTGLLVACATLPETGRKAFFLTTPSQEAQMGASAFTQLKQSSKVSGDPVVNEQVQRVAQRVIAAANMPELKWEVVVFDDPTPNAFALPGGKIGVHTGILPICKNEAGLAAVLGHEIAHVSQRHGGQRVSQQMALSGATTLGGWLASDDPAVQQRWMAAIGMAAQLGIALPYSRKHELEADELGLIYAARAGFDPREAPRFWQRMADANRGAQKPPEFLSTHPSDQNRIAQLNAMMPRAMAEYERSGIR